MINFDFQTSLEFHPNLHHKQWLKTVIRHEGLLPGDISYLFCDDEFLLVQNQKFLNHDTLTDIITFDKCYDNIVSGDIMISVDRIFENAQFFNVTFEREFLRVVAHGVLHLCGYKDKSDEDAKVMRQKENESLALWDAMMKM